MYLCTFVLPLCFYTLLCSCLRKRDGYFSKGTYQLGLIVVVVAATAGLSFCLYFPLPSVGDSVGRGRSAAQTEAGGNHRRNGVGALCSFLFASSIAQHLQHSCQRCHCDPCVAGAKC